MGFTARGTTEMTADGPGNDGAPDRIDLGAEQSMVAPKQMHALLDRIDRLIASIDSLTEAVNRPANTQPDVSVWTSASQGDLKHTSQTDTDSDQGLSALRRQRQRDNDLVYGSRDRDETSPPRAANAPTRFGKAMTRNK